MPEYKIILEYVPEYNRTPAYYLATEILPKGRTGKIKEGDTEKQAIYTLLGTNDPDSYEVKKRINYHLSAKPAEKELEQPHADAFRKALAEMNPIEITWAFSMLADLAKDRIKSCEEEYLRHHGFVRDDQAAEAMERVPFYKKLIELRNFWREAEMEWSAPQIVDAIMEHNRKR